MSDPFPGYDRCIYRFENVCREESELALGDETYKVFLNADGTRGSASDELKDFLHLLRDGYGKSRLVKKIEEQVVKAREHKEWRLEYMTLYMRDRQNREEGFEEGRKEGNVEGREDQKMDSIMNALKKGYSISVAADIVGCTVEEAQKIADELMTASVK